MSARPAAAAPPSPAEGRLCLVLGALLWSLSGFFVKLLRQDTSLGLNAPEMGVPSIAFYRALFAGLVLVPTLRRRDLTYRPAMLGMAACFTAMNALYVTAVALGTAANAILLQYTAPLWMYLASVLWLGEPAERRNTVALAGGLLGVAVIVVGGWGQEGGAVIGIALTSGVAYACVMLFLRVLRDESSRWLTVVNHLGAALVLAPFVWGLPTPTAPQLATLFVFGAVQMALPYWLVARGLRSVSPQEAGAITLLEPLLNPLWAYLVAPDTERPSTATLVGGACILGALIWRYAPRRPTSLSRGR